MIIFRSKWRCENWCWRFWKWFVLPSSCLWFCMVGSDYFVDYGPLYLLLWMYWTLLCHDGQEKFKFKCWKCLKIFCIICSVANFGCFCYKMAKMGRNGDTAFSRLYIKLKSNFLSKCSNISFRRFMWLKFPVRIKPKVSKQLDLKHCICSVFNDMYLFVIFPTFVHTVVRLTLLSFF